MAKLNSAFTKMWIIIILRNYQGGYIKWGMWYLGEVLWLWREDEVSEVLIFEIKKWVDTYGRKSKDKWLLVVNKMKTCGEAITKYCRKDNEIGDF